MQVLSIGRKKRIHAVAFSPSGRELATASGDGQLRVWDLATGRVRQAVPIDETSCGYDLAYLGEDRLVFAGVDLLCWDIPANSWKYIQSGMRWARRLRVSPDGRYLAEVDQATSTEMGGSGLLVHRLDGPDLRPHAMGELFPDLADPTHTTGGLAFSPDGRWLATGHILQAGERRRHLQFAPGGFPVPVYEYTVRLREVPSGRVVQSVDGWQQGVSHLAFSPTGTTLVGTTGPRLRVWDLQAGREVALHKRGTRHFQGLAFTAGGRYLASVSNDETVRVWDARSWQEHTTFTWGIGRLLNIALDPEGFRAAAGSDTGQIIIWDLEG
jgi:WD40 repeat protein